MTTPGKIRGSNKSDRKLSGKSNVWKTLMKEMDDTRGQPYYKKMEYLKECFSKDTLKDILETGIPVNQDSEEDMLRVDAVDSNFKFICKRSQSQSEVAIEEKPQKPTNPYLNFMKKPKEQAQIWRPSRKPTFQELPLSQKAAITEEAIATDFDDWWNRIGSVGKSDIDKDTILDLFQVLCKHPVATSVNQNIQQLGAVPRSIAEAMGFPQCMKTECVSRLLRKDMAQLKRKPPQTVAFNKMLPVELRCKPMSKTAISKWFWEAEEEDDLASMADVWRGLTHLASIRIYCYWLLKNPEAPRPPFLVKEGLLDKEYLDSVSQDLIDAGINSNLDFSSKMVEINSKKQDLQQTVDDMKVFIEYHGR